MLAQNGVVNLIKGLMSALVNDQQPNEPILVACCTIIHNIARAGACLSPLCGRDGQGGFWRGMDTWDSCC